MVKAKKEEEPNKNVLKINYNKSINYMLYIT